MKNILFILLFLLIGIKSNGQRRIDRKVIKENKISEAYIYKFNVNTKDSLMIEQDFFNDNGNVIKKVDYNDEGKIILKYINDYENNLITKQIGYDEFDKITTTFIYKYDANKNLIEFIESNPDGAIKSYQKRNYNKLNQATELYTKDKDSLIFNLKVKYKNYKEGQFDVVSSYNSKGNFIVTKKSEYDKNEKIIKFIEINKRETQTIAYKYNDKLKLIEKTVKSDRTKNIERKVKLKYDINDNLVEEIIYENDVPKSMERYYYKKFGT